jgi:hypothetical protein
MNIPQSELDEVYQAILSRPDYFEPPYVIDAYENYGLNVIPDAFSKDVILLIQQALLTQTPFSVIRIGDGEANLLSYSAYPTTPHLNQHVIKVAIASQADRFNVDPTWMLILKDLMIGSLLQADIIGVVGLWRTGQRKAEDVAHDFLKHPRAFSGHWRAIDFMLHLASSGAFNNKTIASAHLYFSVLEHLHDILLHAKKVFILSSRKPVADELARRYPDIRFEYISVGLPDEKPLSDKPDFLSATYSMLPDDMSGSLSLIGAGTRAEIYCTWIKQKGGVAVDIGSGFDLLDGRTTRPIHKKLELDKTHQYSL